MWHINNKTPFQARGNFTRDRDGAEYWVVAIRGIFAISADGHLEVHDGQIPPLIAPRYDGEEVPELLDEADLFPFRQNVDVVLSGEAQPSTKGQTLATFGFRLEKLEKFAVARPKRRARLANGAWRLADEDPIGAIRLSWRASLGGIDPLSLRDGPRKAAPFNPIGRGWSEDFAAAEDGLELDLPSIEGIGAPWDPRRALPASVGFGPIPPAWQPRLGHAGTYDENWRRTRAPLVPQDFSEMFHQSVPADQIYRETIRGGEPVSVHGMHPQGDYFFRIPKIVFRGKTKMRREWHRIDFRIIGLRIEGTEKLLHLIWNATVPCTGADHLVETTALTVDRIGGLRPWPNPRRTSTR